jgi:hypothetical protein
MLPVTERCPTAVCRSFCVLGSGPISPIVLRFRVPPAQPELTNGTGAVSASPLANSTRCPLPPCACRKCHPSAELGRRTSRRVGLLPCCDRYSTGITCSGILRIRNQIIDGTIHQLNTFVQVTRPDEFFRHAQA